MNTKKVIWEALSKSAICLTVAVGSGTALADATMYVNGTSGSWDDGANYSGGVAPGEHDMFWYNTRRFNPTGDRPVTLSLDGKTHYLRRFYMDMDGGTAAPEGVKSELPKGEPITADPRLFQNTKFPSPQIPDL